MNAVIIITVLLSIWKAVGGEFFPLPMEVYFGWFLLLSLILLLKKPKINKLGLTFIFIAFFSLVINIEIILSYLNVWERLITFVVMFASIGPLFRGGEIDRFKKKLFIWLYYALILLLVASFLIYILRLPMGYKLSRGGVLLFTGLFSTSMTLSPMAAIASIFSLNRFYQLQKKSKYLFLFSFVVCFLMLLVGASRGAIGAYWAALLLYNYLFFYGKFRKLIKYIIIAGFCAALSSSLWLGYLSNVVEKQNQREDAGDIYAGRDRMWKDRIQEFEDNPIFGVGFGNIMISTNSIVDEENGGVESGSGWLTVLSSTGIVGFILIFLLFFSQYRYLFRFVRDKNNDFILYSSLIFFFAIHSIIEGYIYGVGGVIFIFMWLSVSMINQTNFPVFNNKTIR